MTTNNVVARLTATKADGKKLIVEVHADSTFTKFYHYYEQDGNKRKTKRPAQLRTTANRNEGLYPMHRAYYMEPGLDKIQEKLEHTGAYQNFKRYVIRKRLYRKLINAAPDALGPLPITKPYNPVHPSQLPIRVVLPEPRRRYSIVNGWTKA